MEFINIIMQRYATKKFDRRRLDDVKIGQLFEMIRYSPSGLNLQPWKVKVVTDQKVKEATFPGELEPGTDHDVFAPAHILCGHKP